MKALFLLSLLLLPLTGKAQTTLTSIQTFGNRRIEKETLLAYLPVKKGDTVNEADLDRALKSLYRTGLFADIELSIEQNKLVVRVVENPVISQVYFEGNKKLDEKILLTEISSQPRGIYTKSKVQGDASHLLEVYRRIGRFNATVVPKIIERDYNRVDVVFEIEEGEPAYIHKISFFGNKAFSSDDLKKVIMSQEEKWYRFMNSTDTYDPERFSYDQELLKQFYMQHGYADFKIKNAQVELAPDKKSFFMTYDIEEGNQYQVSDVVLKSRLPDVKTEMLMPLVTIEKNQSYTTKTVFETIEKLTDYLQKEGYPFINIVPDIQQNQKESTLKVLLTLEEGSRVFVDKIHISGNTRTMDKVIRRELKLQEGDPLNVDKIRRSKQNIENLGYFSKVDVRPVPSFDQEDLTDLEIAVEEKSSGSLSFGLGWSTYNGLLFEAGIQERNLLGEGYVVGASASISEDDVTYDLSFTNPWFMDLPLLFGVNLFHVEHDYKDVSSYNWVTYGGSFRWGWDWTDDLSQEVQYTLQQDEVTDVPYDASILIKEQAGTTVMSSVSQTLSYDRRNNRFNPTTGYVLSLNTEVAGLGGDLRFLKAIVSADKYIPFFEDKLVLSLSSSFGVIQGLGEDVRIHNRFFMGGGNLRGFESSGVGALTKNGDDFLGGNWRALAGMQLTFPLGLPSEIGLKGKLFCDAGVLGKPDDYDAKEVYYSSKPRVSVGFGLIWNSPMGPINIDWGFPLMKEKYDKKEIFRLNFGTGF